MANNKTTLIPIGRFSKMTRLSLKALRLYDAQGLLRPAHVEPSSGYRYYRLEQASRAEMIRVLRSLDMSLPEIQRTVDSENDEVLSAQLQRHRARLTNKLAQQRSALAYLETMIKSKSIIKPYEITLNEEPSRRVAAVKFHTSIGAITGDIQRGLVTLMQGLGQARVSPTGGPMILYYNVIDQESEGDIEIAVPVATVLPSVSGVYSRELEAGTMATTTHRGPYQAIASAYHALTHWVSERGYDITGPTREIYLNDPRTVTADELLTRLEFPVGIQSGEA